MKPKARTRQSLNGELRLIIEDFSRAMWNANKEYIATPTSCQHENPIRFTPAMESAWDELCCILHEESKLMKKAKTLEVKLRSAIRLIWSRSAERRAIIKAASYDSSIHASHMKSFKCPICLEEWPIQMAEVDHEPPLGTFDDWREVKSFIERMFFGPQRAICKMCHKKKTAEQRRKK